MDNFLTWRSIISGKRNDITFLGVGDTREDIGEFEKIRIRAAKIENVILCEKIDSVESWLMPVILGSCLPTVRASQIP